MYGNLDPNTREWTDGLFTAILRRIVDNVRGEATKRHWIIFDGDVDPEWVENLNSVLDDNKASFILDGWIPTVGIYCYRDIEINSFHFQPSKLKPLKASNTSQRRKIRNSTQFENYVRGRTSQVRNFSNCFPMWYDLVL